MDKNIVQNLHDLTPNLLSSNREVFGHIIDKKKKLMAIIRGIQNSPSYGVNPHLDRLESRLSKDLDVVLNQEESLWFQKSWRQWIEDGDRNT